MGGGGGVQREESGKRRGEKIYTNLYSHKGGGHGWVVGMGCIRKPRVSGLRISYLWLAGNEGMEKIEIIILGYIGTTIRIHSFKQR